VLLKWTLRLLLALQILQPTVSNQQLILLKTVRLSVTVVREVKLLIHLGSIFGVLVANEGVFFDVSDVRAVWEVFGVFDKWYISFLQYELRNKSTESDRPHFNEREICQFS
jgi:hypothetical protein